MAESKLASKFRQIFYNFVKEVGENMEQDILDAFDSEFGYDEDGEKVQWDELSTRYVNQKPPRGRGGSANPILNFEGDLRNAVKVKVSGATIDTDVTSQKMKPRGKGDTISVADISSILSVDRPHTNPSAKWLPHTSEGEKNLNKLFAIHFEELYEEIRQGLYR